MMEKVFVDTNILLDVLFEREGYQASMEILQLGEDGRVKLCTSVLSMANVAYLIRKGFSAGELVATLAQLEVMLEILPMDKEQFHDALLLAGPDFEDILQAVCAQKAQCAVLITHNPKDFVIRQGLSETVNLPRALTPEDYLLSTQK